MVLRESERPGWLGDLASTEAKRRRARRKFSLSECQACGKPGTDRHHIDANPGNNSPENVKILCRRCHMRDLLCAICHRIKHAGS